MSPFAGEYAAHPITEALRDSTLFHMARSVGAASEAEEAFTVLVRTGPESWGETDLGTFFTDGRAELDDADTPGPVAVALAGTVALGGEGEEGAEPARLVVMGDSDFATNPLIHQFPHRDLFLNSVNWLLGDVEAISIRPDSARASRIQLTRTQFSQIRYLSLFVLPEAIAVLGVFVWWRRPPDRRGPRTMNPRATALLAVVVLLAGAAVFWFEIRGADRRAERRRRRSASSPASRPTPSTGSSSVRATGKDARLERSEGVWRLTAPLEFPADDAAASGLASSLTRLLRGALP